uniref:Uncharacterized protein n=1 Tax=Arundo donax TaxID=35708 RepID=A0A0A8ZSB4_ARUDO
MYSLRLSTLKLRFTLNKRLDGCQTLQKPT